MADPVSGVLRRPFDEQVAAFRTRLGDLVPTARWDDIRREQHDRAFMVAGAMKADLLADLAAAVDRGISEGTGIEAFRRDFRAIVQRHGWHGWTGEGTEAGEAWRTRVIFQTNMRVSYAAGRHAQLVEGGFAFWVYRHSGAAHPRLDHLSWDGVALEPEHPFWASHYPPNGWGCGCKVRGARTRAGIRRVGGDPDKKLPAGWDAIDPRTGAPEGIGKGWDYAPGASASAEIRGLTEKLVGWPYQLGKAFMTSLPPAQADAVAEGFRRLPTLADELRRYAERAIGERNGAPIDPLVKNQPYRTMGLLTSDQAEEFGALTGRELAGFDWTLDSSAVEHVLKQHGDPAREAGRNQVGLTVDAFSLLPQLLLSPEEVELDGRRLIMRRRSPGGRLVAVFDVRQRRKMLALVTMWMERI